MQLPRDSWMKQEMQQSQRTAHRLEHRLPQWRPVDLVHPVVEQALVEEPEAATVAVVATALQG